MAWIIILYTDSNLHDCISDVMTSLLHWSAVPRLRVQSQSGPTKEYEIGICLFSAKQAVLRDKNKNGLTRTLDNVSDSNDMSIRRLLFQWGGTVKIKLRALV